MWQHGVAATTQTSAPAAAVRSAPPGGGSAHASFLNSKTVWIGAAAVVVLATVLTGMMLLRGGGNSHSAAAVPDTTNPPADKNVPNDPNPGPKDVTPTPKTTPASGKSTPQLPAVQASADPIVGCYQWFSNVPVTIRADSTMVAGPSVRLSYFGHTHRRKHRAHRNVALGKRMGCVRVSEWHVYKRVVSRNVALGGCVARDLRDDVAQPGG
jgi:hypothetical protein